MWVKHGVADRGMWCILRVLGGIPRLEGLGICRNEIRQSSIWRDWRVGVGVRVRGSMKERCRFIGHARTAALQAAATLDVLAVRQVKCKQDATAGKSGLIDIVRMLVAWERNLEER